MALFVLSFFIYLAVQSATAQECKTGRSLVKDVLQVQDIAGLWKLVLINQKEFVKNISCTVGDIKINPVEILNTNSSLLDTSIGGTVTLLASILPSGNVVNITFPDDFSDWNGPYEILATKPGQFLILGACPAVTDGKPLVAILFKEWTPSDDDLNAAKKDFSDTGLDINNLNVFCELSKL